MTTPEPTPPPSDVPDGLTEDEREALDQRVADDLWGYYLHFEATGEAAVDRVLSALGLAAKAFHHTEGWSEDLDFGFGPIPKGETCAGFIQRAAIDAARRIAARDAEWAQRVATVRDRLEGLADAYSAMPLFAEVEQARALALMVATQLREVAALTQPAAADQEGER